MMPGLEIAIIRYENICITAPTMVAIPIMCRLGWEYIALIVKK